MTYTRRARVYYMYTHTHTHTHAAAAVATVAAPSVYGSKTAAHTPREVTTTTNIQGDPTTRIRRRSVRV